MAEAAAIVVLKATVGGLLSMLAKDAVSPAWNRDKNFKSLGGILAQLQPIVESIQPSTVANASVKTWLEGLKTRLESVEHVLQKNKVSVSKQLVKEIKLLSEILSTAPVVVLSLSIAASAEMAGQCERLKEIIEQLEGFQDEVRRQFLAQTTRQALDTAINNHGRRIGLITANQAYLSIKEEADSFFSSSTDVALVEASEQSSSSSTNMRLDNTETMFGGDEVVEEAKKLLLLKNIDKIGLCASGGAGKTHAARRVFYDDSIRAHFTGGCFWLTVGTSFSVEKLLRNLLFEITGSSNVRRNISNEELKNQLRMEVAKKKDILIVLDDVWESHVLCSLDVASSELGCKVFVTTRNDSVLNKSHVTKLRVPLLSWDNSWKLFCWQAFRGVSLVPPELKKLAEDVTQECKGLPLALKVIGSVFAGKIEKGYWKLSLEKLRNADILDQDHEKLYERLKLSIDDLPTIDSRLKDCFFYFAAFPEDWEVGLYEDLLPLWIGERIVGKEVGNCSYDPKLEACELIGWLVSRSLIELRVCQNGRNEWSLSCTMHDVLRDLARYILQHKIAVTQRECLYETGRNLEFPGEWVYAEDKDGKRGKATLAAQRMSVMGIKLKKLPRKLLDAPNLKVVLLRDNPFKVIPDTFFNNLRNICVLDLRRTYVTSLPKSIGILKFLLVLNLSYTHLQKLPNSLGKLTKLEQLYLHGCDDLSQVPRSLCSLGRLRILRIERSGLDIWKCSRLSLNFVSKKFVLHDLRSLVALEHLSMSSCSHETLPPGLLTALKRLEKLELLGFTQLQKFPDLSPNDLQHLQFLDLSACSSLTSLPSSFQSLPLLHTLNLDGCVRLESLPALDGLQNLVKLQLTRCCGLKFLPATFGRNGAFPALEELDLTGCCKVASFPELEDGAMPCLKFLDLSGWNQLDTVPKGLSRLKELRFLDLCQCSNLKTLEHDHLTFQSFANLEELNLDHCHSLTELPESLALLPRFRLLRMRRCGASIPVNLEQAISEGRVELER